MGAPFGVQSLHPAECVAINKPVNEMWSIATSNHVTRYRCRDCGSPVFAILGKRQIYVVPRSMLFQQKGGKGTGDGHEDLEDPDYRPQHHMYYGSRILNIHDDLPKYVGTSHASRAIVWKEESACAPRK